MSRIRRRDFLEHLLHGAALAAAVPTVGAAALAAPRRKEDPLGVGVIGLRGRGRGHIAAFKASPDARVVALCDVDEAVAGPARKAAPDARFYRDLRRMLEDPEVDVVSIATPNHWHTLATAWALQAGKHVYVEKPISHDLREGEQLARLAEASGLVVQHGTQARSAQATRDAMTWLRAGGLGEVRLARGLCYKRRGPIGLAGESARVPETVDYDLWTGPAALEPLRRKNLHYDWHWVFNTGNGDIGNQGAHQMDIARWGLGLERLPERVLSVGGRVGYEDDGETPNTQVAHLDFGDAEIIFEVRGLKTEAYRGASIGVVFEGADGYLVSASYEKVVAFDADGQVARTFEGGGNHFQDFLDAVRRGDGSQGRATARAGHLSSACCHLANLSHRLGAPGAAAQAGDGLFRSEAANEAAADCRAHLEENGLDSAALRTVVGADLALDPETGRFAGESAAAAEALAGREKRAPFRMPEAL